MTDSTNNRALLMTIVPLAGLVATMTLAANFGSVLYFFGFGATLIAHVVQSQIMGIRYVDGEGHASRSRTAIAGQVFFILIALLLLGIGFYDVFWK